MIDGSGTFAAWGSSVIDGLVAGTLGAIFVVFGVSYGQRLTTRHAKSDARQRAAAELMVEVSNLRDAACGRRARTGDYPLVALRNALFTTYLALHDYPSHAVVDEFYKAVQVWRQWVRDRLEENARVPIEVRFPFFDDYRAELRSYGDQVIRVLQDDLETDPLAFRPPELMLPSP